ncbi:MAG: peptide deformylase [Candidatus Kaelpia aquatica]|nr:peptide deformylase [Candidatus Kaelpia aquatica]
MSSRDFNREVLKYPEIVLRRKTRPVKVVDEDVLKLIRLMIDVMLKTHGVGLSANQIGQNLRIFVASPRLKREEVYVFINPRILNRSGAQTDQEGCLSVPGFNAFIKRYDKVTVEALDVDGKKFKIKTEGFMARIIQHEIDHLNGKLLIQKLSYRERKKHLKSVLNKEI